MKRKMCCLVLCAALLISGCSLRFTLPDETEPSQVWNESTGAVEQETKPTAPPTETPTQEQKHALFPNPFACDFYLGEQESGEIPSFAYEGGELHVPFNRKHVSFYNENRELCTNKCGFLLFLDGRPQPYKLTEDGEYQYMHMGQAEEDEIGEFIFTPVTGQEGDDLELYVLLVTAPDWGISDNPINAQIEWIRDETPISNSKAAAAIVRMNQSPEELTQPEITDHMKSLSITQGEWNEDDTQYTLNGQARLAPLSSLPQKQLSAIKLIGIRHYAAMTDWGFAGLDLPGYDAWNYAYNVKEDSEVPLRYVFQSDLDQKLDLIVYINNVPVTVDPEKRITVTGGGEEKTIVDFTLDMAGCGDVAMVYMVAVSRNYWEGTDRQNENFGVYVLPAMYVLTPLENYSELREAMFPSGDA